MVVLEIKFSIQKKIPKTYEAVIEGKISDAVIKKLEEGIDIQLEENDGIVKYHTLPSKIKILSTNKHPIVEIIISEGKKRQVKRMFEAINCKVLKLKRVKIGKFELKNLSIGEIKEISKLELFKALFE